MALQRRPALAAPRDYLSTFVNWGPLVCANFHALHAAHATVHRSLMEPGPSLREMSVRIYHYRLRVSGFHALISSGTTPKLIRRNQPCVFQSHGESI